MRGRICRPLTATKRIPLSHEDGDMPVEFAAYDPDEAGDGFRLSDGTEANEILEFLVDQSGKGFTPEEISEATDVPRESVRTTLASLEARDLVRHREPYWAIGLEDRLGVYEGMLEGMEAMKDRHGDDDWTGWEEMAVDPRPVDE